MTPAARVQAAVEILDTILAGAPAEQALTRWARASRFAGSSDRAAVRDHVFDALRCRRSFAALGGAETGRGLMMGALRGHGEGPEALFTGAPHAPAPLTEPEKAHLASTLSLDPEVALDVPAWLAPELKQSLGPDYHAVMEALRHRAPVFLRVNLARASRDAAQAALAREGIETMPHPLAKSALEVTVGLRKIQNSEAYRNGVVELQDAASQVVVEMLPLARDNRVLDYCAGGGGKSLALAARAPVRIFAHDADPARMRDLPARAARAGAEIETVGTAGIAERAPFDLILADVPCSGSGSWRRAPEAKWRLSPGRLDELRGIQCEILVKIAPWVAPGGWLAYATCSLLDSENADQITGFLSAHPGWRLERQRRLTPLDGGDGFYCALMRRDSA